MAWPLSQDYNEAIQNPASSFGDEELRQGQAASNALGMPMPRSGNFADVYEVTSPNAGRWAVKCFTREVAGLQERYAAISAFLAATPLPFLVDFQFQPQGMRIRGQWYPILKMQWVEGLLLNQFVRDHLDKPAILEGLSKIWVRLSKALREAGFAHADLQHGNIILVPSSRAGALALKLIDYDGMYVPALAQAGSGELGHPSFQHPERVARNYYGPEVDRLPLLAVACALRALTFAGKSLWDRYDNGDNLLFREADLRDPASSNLFRELWRMPDPATHDLTGYLAMSLKNELTQVPWLDLLISNDRPGRLNTAQEAWVNGWLGPGGNSPLVSSAPVAIKAKASTPHLPPPVTLPREKAAAPSAGQGQAPVGQLVSASPPPILNPFAIMQGARAAKLQARRTWMVFALLGGVAVIGLVITLLLVFGGTGTKPTISIKPLQALIKIETGENPLLIQIERHGYQGPIKLTVQNLPQDVDYLGTEIKAKESQADLKITAQPEANSVFHHEITIIAEGIDPPVRAVAKTKINVNVPEN